MTDIVLDIRQLVWDGTNGAHVWQKHGVRRAEVEEVVAAPATDLWVQGTYQDRYFVIGPKVDGTLLVLILAPKGRGRYYPVTAYVAGNKDRREYYQWKAEQQT